MGENGLKSGGTSLEFLHKYERSQFSNEVIKSIADYCHVYICHLITLIAFCNYLYHASLLEVVLRVKPLH